MSNWANKGKQDAQSIPVSNGLTVTSGRGGEDIVAFYNYNPPTEENPGGRQLKKGMRIVGTYAGSLKTKTYGTVYHKIRTEEGLVAVNGAAKLSKSLEPAKEGARVEITYLGKEAYKDKAGQAKSAHDFLVAVEILG